jgi:proteasome lid subunit RPN8/RPN11
MSDTAMITDRDISAVEFADWPHREMQQVHGKRDSRFQVVYKQSVLDEIHRHGQQTPEIEVCGVLVGNCYRDLRGPYLLIENCIRGNQAKMKSTAVTFTTDTWQHIHQTMDSDHPDQKIVGWYHTHPGFGIFLSEMDVFICDGFFNLPWQTAFVFDPQSEEEGNFIWRAGRPDRDEVLIENDLLPPPETAPTPSETDQIIVELRIRVRRLERRLTALAMVFAFTIAFAAMWKLGYISDVQPQPTTQPTTQSVSAP